MALHTVTLVLDETWRLISNTAGRLRLSTDSVDGALIVLADVAPPATYGGGQKDRQLDIVSLETKAWARAAVKRAVVTVTRVVDAANHQEIVLGDLGLSTTSFASTILAGADVATITGRVAGDSIKLLPVAGGLIEASSDGSKIVRALGPISVKTPEIEIEIEQSHPLAANSPKRTRFVVKVTGSLGAGGGVVISPLMIVQPVGRLTRAGVKVAQLPAGSAILGGTNNGHFAVDASGAVTVSAAGQTAGLQVADYALAILGGAISLLTIPTEPGNVLDISDEATKTAAINFAYATSPTTDWLLRPRPGTVVSATSAAAGFAITGKNFLGTFVDPNKGKVQESQLDRAASIVLSGGSLTIRPRVPLSAKILGAQNATSGRGLVFVGSRNIAIEDMVIENVAGADGYMRQIDGSDTNITPNNGTSCVYATSNTANPSPSDIVLRRCVIGAPDDAPYTRYPIGVDSDFGNQVVLEDCTIKNTYVGIRNQTTAFFTHRRCEIKNFLVDAVDGYPNNLPASGYPTFPALECFYAASDFVIHSPNLGSEFAGAHCDGEQTGASPDDKPWRLSIHFGIWALDADENVKQTQAILLKDVPASVFIRGRVSNCIGVPSTLNGGIFGRMDPNDRLVLDHCTFVRSTKAVPVNAGPARITVQTSFGDPANVCGPLITNCIFGVFMDQTGAAAFFYADPNPSGLGTRTLTTGGTAQLQNNLYLSQLTPNTGAGNSLPEAFEGFAASTFIAGRGWQFSIDYTSKDTIQTSGFALFKPKAGGPAVGRGASLVAANVDQNRMMFASTRTGWPLMKAVPSDTQLARVSQTGFMTPDYAVNNLRPAFANFAIDNAGAISPELDTGNPLTLYKVSLLVGSTYYPVTFGGQASATIADGATLVADPVVVPGGIPARTKCYWIVGDNVLSGQSQPGGFDRQNNNGEKLGRAATFTDGWFDGSVAVPSNTNLTGTNTGRIYGPSVVLATGWDGRPVVMCEGDSMAAAANDIGNFTPASGVQGWLARGLDSNDNGTQRLPHANFCVTGTRPSGMSSRAAGKYQRRGQFMDALRAVNLAAGKSGTDGKGLPPFTAILSEHINNDASGNPVTADLQNIMNAYWAFLRSEYPDARIVQTAAMCATTADNGQWTTLASQSYRTADTTAGTGSRWQVSDGYIASKPAVLDAVIDQTPLIMDVTLRKWSPRSYTGALAADYVAGSLSVSLTTAPAIGEAIVVNAGTGNTTRPHFVAAVTGSGPYAVTLFSALINLASATSQGITAGASVAATGVADGLHASPLVHAELAAAIVAAKAAGKFGSSSGGSSAVTTPSTVSHTADNSNTTVDTTTLTADAA